MNPNLSQSIFLFATLLSAIGLLYIIYSRNIKDKSNQFFSLSLILIAGYMVSHGVHFLFMAERDVTMLDISCHSFLLLIIVTLTFFTLNFHAEKKYSYKYTAAILIPSLIALIMLWTGNLISGSHAHDGIFETHYRTYYPVFLIWYIFLIIFNITLLIKKLLKTNDRRIRSQIKLFLLGVIITNLTSFLFGLFLPWILGFHYLVEMSPLAFLAGVLLFTGVAIGKYNMFPAASDKINRFSINKKMVLNSLILTPVIILIIQIPIGRLIFNIQSNAELGRYFLISLFTGIIVSLSITFIILQIISNPLNILKTKVLEVEKGNYGAVTDYNSNDEIGELAQAFNKMSTTLKSNLIDLQQKEKRILTLISAFDKSTAAFASVNKDFLITDANQKFCKIIGKTKEDSLNKSIVDLQFVNNKNEFDTIIAAIRRGNKFENEVRFTDENGEAKFFIISVAAAYSSDNQISGYLFVYVDVTYRKNLEEQLLKTEKLAALGKMAAILTHEIKTPLTSIKLNAEMLSDTLILNDDDKSSFDIILKEIGRLNNLVKEVLQFARQSDLNYGTFSIKDAAESVLLECKNKMLKKNISYINTIDNIEVEADEEKIRQTLLNLTDNAIEAITENGLIELYSQTDLNKNLISVFVKDNGTGIKDNASLFEPFITTKVSGTGLGLSISQKIIEQHKGTLRLLSSTQGETIFTAALPIKRMN
jgi:PAS domain S-box-containing protein